MIEYTHVCLVDNKKNSRPLVESWKVDAILNTYYAQISVCQIVQKYPPRKWVLGGAEEEDDKSAKRRSIRASAKIYRANLARGGLRLGEENLLQESPLAKIEFQWQFIFILNVYSSVSSKEKLPKRGSQRPRCLRLKGPSLQNPQIAFSGWRGRLQLGHDCSLLVFSFLVFLGGERRREVDLARIC